MIGGLVNQMVERGILFDEAVGLNSKSASFKRVLDRANANQSARRILGIHRNTLSRKIDEYKLDLNGHRRLSTLQMSNRLPKTKTAPRVAGEPFF